MLGAVAVLFALLLTVLAAGSTDLTGEAVRAVWARSEPWRFVVAVAVMTLGLVFLALRWRALMTDRERVRVLPLTGIFMVGTLLNYALPGPVGEFAAAALAGRRFGVSPEMAFAAGAHGRFVGLAVAGTVSGLLFLATDMPVPEGMHAWVGAATAAIALGALALGLVSARPELLRAAARATTGRIRRLAALHSSIERLADALAGIGRLGPGRYAAAVGWAVCGHAAVAGGVYLAATGLGAWPDPAGLAFTYTVATAGAVVLFAFPGAQVGWDAMFATLLVQTAGVALPDALAVTLLVRAQQLLTVLLGGLALVVVAPAGADEAAGGTGAPRASPRLPPGDPDDPAASTG